MKDILCGIELSTLHAMVSVHASVKLYHVFASCFLMQSVNILGNDCF